MNSEEQKNIVQEFKKFGIEFIDNEAISTIKNLYGVEVECKLKKPLPFDYTNLVLSRPSNINQMYYFFDFKKIVRDGEELQKFTIAHEPDPLFLRAYKINLDFEAANTFADFCWYYSNGTTPHTLEEVEMPLREKAILGDLTKLLPGKFVYDFVELMWVSNDIILNGNMQNSVMYGPKMLTQP